MTPKPTEHEVNAFIVRFDACPQARGWASECRTFEELWRNCKKPEWFLWAVEQLEFRQEGLRLFACACARRCWQLLDDERSKKAVECAERFAAGRASKDELASAWASARAAANDAARKPNWSMSAAAARLIACDAVKAMPATAARDASKSGLKVAAWVAATETAVQDEEVWQTNKLREILAPDLPALLIRARTPRQTRT